MKAETQKEYRSFRKSTGNTPKALATTAELSDEQLEEELAKRRLGKEREMLDTTGSYGGRQLPFKLHISHPIISNFKISDLNISNFKISNLNISNLVATAGYF